MKSKLLLVCALGCFTAPCAEGVDKFVSATGGSAFARPGELPYVVGIIRPKFGSSLETCAGSIIDEKFVLTAAHCLADVIKENDDGTYTSKFVDSWAFVFANTTNLVEDAYGTWYGVNRTRTSTMRKAVKAYFVSEYFNSGLDDIAIVELESPLNLNDGYHRKINLPFRRKILYEGVRAVLAGFGEDEDQTNVNNGGLKKTHFRVVPYSKCQYPAAEAYRRNSMCLMSVSEDNEHSNDPLGACDGDSGGPIVHGNTLIGIMTSVSGVTCDDRNEYPQISLNVRYYKDFINNVIDNRHGRLGNKQSITEFKFEA